MNQEKIGEFIAQIRNEKHMTQKELAEKLNVTDRAVSNWERGRRMPDYGVIMELCRILDITLNELFTGERIAENEFKQRAEENLLSSLENSTFTLKEKIEFYKKKWLKEHLSKILLCAVSEIVLIISLCKQKIDLYLIITIASLLAFIFYIYLYNQMMRFIEINAYHPKDHQD